MRGVRAVALAAYAVAALVCGPLTRAGAQVAAPPASVSHLGLAATGSVTLFQGVGLAQTADLGYEFGGGIDLGWMGSPKTRLVADVTYLNSLLRFRDSIGVRHRGPFYDFGVAVGALRLLPRRGRIEPFVRAGVGVDVIGSNVRQLSVDVLYNANRFALHAATGAFVTLSSDGQDGFQLELRGTAVRELSHGSARIGYVRFLGSRKWTGTSNTSRPVAVQRDSVARP